VQGKITHTLKHVNVNSRLANNEEEEKEKEEEKKEETQKT
jgi:hypothetical protein